MNTESKYKQPLFRHKKTGQIHFVCPQVGGTRVVTVQTNILNEYAETNSWLGSPQEFPREFAKTE